MQCLNISPGESLTYFQKKGLELVSLFQGRDVILAIDVTSSVGLNNEGRIRLRQIIKDSLKSGDSVYFVPFASSTSPVAGEDPIKFQRREEDIDLIINKILLATNSNSRLTDIQLAEHQIYRGLAQLNQCRLEKSQPIKSQSVVWITDAPLFTPKGITSEVWVEMLGLESSPFGDPNSLQSQDRDGWIEKLRSLPIQERTQEIATYNQQTYPITVVDIPPVVQEFCTPIPGGKQTCLVNAYLISQLWMPVGGAFLLLLTALISGLLWKRQHHERNSPWRLTIEADAPIDQETETVRLPNGGEIAIGGFDMNSYQSFRTPGDKIRAYLKREGKHLYLMPTHEAPIFWNGNSLERKVEIRGQNIELNCPDGNNRDFYLKINLKR